MKLISPDLGAKLARIFHLPRPLTMVETVLSICLAALGVALLIVALAYQTVNQDLSGKLTVSESSEELLTDQLASVSGELARVQSEFDALLNEDQVKRNRELAEEIRNIQTTFRQAVTQYEDIIKLRDQTTKTQAADVLFTQALLQLSRREYAPAKETLQKLDAEVGKLQQQLAAALVIPANVPEKATPPDAGYSRQKVVVDGVGEFLVDIVTADLNSTRVIVDTASDSDCSDNCPVLPLATYVARSGAFAGINGSYFCPASYPSCAGKTNTFDTLAMNKNKVYFNSANNVYSAVPAVIFQGSSARFVRASSEWGRDTGVDAVLANQPLLTFGGSVAFGGDDDPKKGSKGNRSFVGATGSKVYIGVVRSATVAEAARVVNKMGIESALNLDNGGSTALWSGGYKLGPGRDLPNVLLFVRK
jgi:hypothetical protein